MRTIFTTVALLVTCMAVPALAEENCKLKQSIIFDCRNSVAENPNFDYQACVTQSEQESADCYARKNGVKRGCNYDGNDANTTCMR